MSDKRPLLAALMGTSTGPFGAVRGLSHLRQVLMALGVWLVPSLVTLARAGSAFDESGALRDPAPQAQLETQLEALLARL